MTKRKRQELLIDTKEKALDYIFGGLPLLTDILRPNLTYEDAWDTSKWAALIEKAADDGIITNEAQLLVIKVGLDTIEKRMAKFATMVDKYTSAPATETKRRGKS